MSKKTSNRLKALLAVVFLIVFGVQSYLLLSSYSFPVLSPSGSIAEQQKNLIYLTMLMSLIVIIPVFFMLFRFITKYNEKNQNEKYQPELDGNKTIEVVWWAVPIILVSVLSVITYKTSHSLDPSKPIQHEKPAMTVQVIAMPWKWLFIYPEQNIASINYVKLPVDRPIEFRLTSDAPMNSFWIPELGGQMYAMAGMATELNLIANNPGEFKGLSSNISGEGFAGMRFTASAVYQDDFDKWVEESQRSDKKFDKNTYQEKLVPSTNESVQIFKLADSRIFDDSIDKFMSHGYVKKDDADHGEEHDSDNHEGMQH